LEQNTAIDFLSLEIHLRIPAEGEIMALDPQASLALSPPTTSSSAAERNLV